MGRVVQFDIPASDLARACQFYSGAFGLTCAGSDTDNAEEVHIRSDNLELYGRIRKDTAASSDGAASIRVNCIDDAVKRVLSNGGKVLVAKKSLPKLGYMAYCEDSEGNTIGLFAEDSSAM